ncbi:MAG: rane protein [Myxococcales bacterium]|nr:rane protein [Myxococcales bacterium]
MTKRSPLVIGVAFAIIAAVSFGITAPVVAWASHSAGSLATASLLYAGAAVSAIGARLIAKRSPNSLVRTDALRVAMIALFGAVLAPTLLVWGLHRTGALTASLMLNLEAVFTVLFAYVIQREAIGSRVWIAVTLMAAGGAALSLDAATRTAGGVIGALAVAGATIAWALDNTLTQPLSTRDPLDVVGAKAGLGATSTAILAVALHDRWPETRDTAILLACGMTGYGLSLRFYILAQRRIGAARTGSVFALAPFIGALVSWIAGERAIGTWALASIALFAIGVWLHLTEKHRHAHTHAAVEHAHLHRHDDHHHLHDHDPPVIGEHSHPHAHEPVTHDHEHHHEHDDHHHEHR